MNRIDRCQWRVEEWLQVVLVATGGYRLNNLVKIQIPEVFRRTLAHCTRSIRIATKQDASERRSSVRFIG
jgi:hypothetical protein